MDYPLVNGIRFSYASIDLAIKGTSYLGVRAVNYADTLEPGLVRGIHAQFLGRTLGDYTCTASIEIFLEEWNELLGEIGDGYMEEVFDISVTYSEEGGPTHTDEIRGCRVGGIEHGHAQGTDPLAVTVTLHPTVVIRDGKNPMKNMLQGTAASVA